MTVLLLHGGFADDFLLDIVLPVLLFAGLYRWADRKSKREKAAKRDGPADGLAAVDDADRKSKREKAAKLAATANEANDGMDSTANDPPAPRPQQ